MLAWLKKQYIKKVKIDLQNTFSFCLIVWNNYRQSLASM